MNLNMKKKFSKLLIILLAVTSLWQLNSIAHNERLVLLPLNFGATQLYTGIERLAITENLSQNILTKINRNITEQKIKIKFSGVRKPAIAPEKILSSSYSPRLAVSVMKNLTDSKNFKKSINIKNVKFLKSKNKTIKIEETKKYILNNIKEITYNEINANKKESNVVLNTNLISHHGFKNNIEKIVKNKWSAYLVENDILEKLSELQNKEKLDVKNKVFAEQEKFKKIDEAINYSIDTGVSDRKISTITNDISDELVFIDYSKNDRELLNHVQDILITGPAPIAEIVDDLQLTQQVNNIDANIKVDKNKVLSVELVTENQSGDDVAISNNVNTVITREMNTNPLTTQKKQLAAINLPTKRKRSNLKTDVLMAGTGYSYKVAEKNNTTDLISSALAAPQKTTTQKENSRTTLSAKEINFKKGELGLINNFEFASAHDLNNRLTDNGAGFINIDINLSASHSIFRGTILKRGMMRTIVNLILGPGTMSVEVPVITQEAMSDILSSHKIDGIGGFVLIELDDEIDTLDIDTNYDAKINLNKKFKEVGALEDAMYVLYLGVAPGNTLLQIKSINDHYAEKVIHVVEDEVLFETPFLVNPEEQKLLLMERNILAREAKELEIFGSEITFFNRKIRATQEALNMFTIKMPALIMGMRKYFEFNHLGETLYLGTWNQEKIEVPSQDFIENVMATLEIENLSGRCLIQVNLPKEIKDIKFGGDTIKGPMNIQYAYLDQDGTMSEEVSELVKKAFFIGELQGLINIEIEYLDHTKEYIQTFCSNETYLVEQL
jgi:hypothetical protein